MAISRRPLDVDNYSALDGGTGLAIPGYYSRVHLNDIINNFIIAYIGDGKVLSKVPRYEVAFGHKDLYKNLVMIFFILKKLLKLNLIVLYKCRCLQIMLIMLIYLF